MRLSVLFTTVGLLGALAIASPIQAQNVVITGAGASFPAPLYTAWVDTYSRATDGVRFNYQSIGSGASVEQFTQRIIDFGASDSAMTDEQIGRIKGGALVLPMTAGEIVLAYNLPGIEEVRLPRDVYPAIYTGEITRWNDERIAAANPDVDLPDMEIRVIVRSDSSGTTFVFTQHLSAINETFCASG